MVTKRGSTDTSSNASQKPKIHPGPDAAISTLGSGSGGSSCGQSSMFICTDCDRTSKDANRCPQRHQGEYVNFASSSQCLSCRNYQNSNKKHKSRDEMNKNLRGEATKEEYKVSLDDFEQVFDTMAGKQMRKLGEHIKLPQWIHAEEEKNSANKKTSFRRGWLRDACNCCSTRDMASKHASINGWQYF